MSTPFLDITNCTIDQTPLIWHFWTCLFVLSTHYWVTIQGQCSCCRLVQRPTGRGQRGGGESTHPFNIELLQSWPCNGAQFASESCHSAGWRGWIQGKLALHQPASWWWVCYSCREASSPAPLSVETVECVFEPVMHWLPLLSVAAEAAVRGVLLRSGGHSLCLVSSAENMTPKEVAGASLKGASMCNLGSSLLALVNWANQEVPPWVECGISCGTTRWNHGLHLPSVQLRRGTMFTTMSIWHNCHFYHKIKLYGYCI